MEVDTTTSTVVIDGRRFPAACLVCPIFEERPDEPEVERLLGGPARPTVGPDAGKLAYQVMIPCENGVLVAVEWHEAHPGVYELALDARTCVLSMQEPDSPLWLPHFVALYGADLRALSERPRKGDPGAMFWKNAEPDWVVELIDRIAAKPFEQPPGPQVRLIPLAEAEKLIREGWPDV